MKKSIGAKPIVYPTPVFLVGSYDEHGVANMMNAAWGGLCSSNPPSIAVSIRPERHSYDNIIQRQAFTINIPSSDQVQVADYFGLVSGKKSDKVKRSGVAIERAEFVDAPMLDDCPLVLECRLIATHDLGAHTQFVGEIVDVKVEEQCLDAAGQPDVRLIDPLLFAPGNRAYFAIGDFVGQAFAVGKDIAKDNEAE